MKKYTKPMIAFESFSLSTNIAACDNEATFVDASCPPFNVDLEDFGLSLNLFMSDACTDLMSMTPGSNDLVCYHVPGFNLNLQGS